MLFLLRPQRGAAAFISHTAAFLLQFTLLLMCLSAVIFLMVIKDIIAYGTNYPKSARSQRLISTTCIEGHFRSAVRCHNSVHANKERSLESSEKGGGR